MGKTLKVRTIVVTNCDGERKETEWESLSEEEKKKLSVSLTNRFMKAAGYVPEDGIA